jgi:hypothetical protein
MYSAARPSDLSDDNYLMTAIVFLATLGPEFRSLDVLKTTASEDDGCSNLSRGELFQLSEIACSAECYKQSPPEGPASSLLRARHAG